MNTKKLPRSVPLRAGLRSGESGQTLILFALFMVALLAMLALVIDGGFIMLHRRVAQNAADAAALAGAYRISTGASDAAVEAMVHEYAITRNGADGFEAVYLPSGALVGAGSQPAGSNGVRVRTTCAFPATFAKVLGHEEFTVAAVAAAAFMEPEEGDCGGYAIWADSDTCNEALHWGGSNNSVAGNVHSNHDIHVGGSNNSVAGETEYVTNMTVGGSGCTFDPPPAQSTVQPLPIEFNIEDYRPGGRAAVAAGSDYHHIQGSLKLGGDANLFGLYYVTGSVKIQAVDGGTFTIVAEQGIKIQSGSGYQPYIDGLLLFSNKNAMGCSGDTIIHIGGITGSWTGVLYAPRGKIHYSATAGSMHDGSLIGWRVDLSGSGWSLTCDDTLCDGGGGGAIPPRLVE